MGHKHFDGDKPNRVNKHSGKHIFQHGMSCLQIALLSKRNFKSRSIKTEAPLLIKPFLPMMTGS
jgi:hypothetical protein